MFRRLRALSCVLLGAPFHHTAGGTPLCGKIVSCSRNVNGIFGRVVANNNSYNFNGRNWEEKEKPQPGLEVAFIPSRDRNGKLIATRMKVADQHGQYTVVSPHATRHGRPAVTGGKPPRQQHTASPLPNHGDHFIVYSLRQHKWLNKVGANWYTLSQEPQSPSPQKAMHKGKYLTVYIVDPFASKRSEHGALVRHIVNAVGREHAYEACGDLVRAVPELKPDIYHTLWDVLNGEKTFLQRLREGTGGLGPLVPLLEYKCAISHRSIYHFLLVEKKPLLVPLVNDFLKAEIQYRSPTLVKLSSSTINSQRAIQLRKQIANLTTGKEKKTVVDAIVDDIVSLPNELQLRARVLFPSALEELLESCARVVYPDNENVRRLKAEAIKQDILELADSSTNDKSLDAIPDVSSDNTGTSSGDEPLQVTYQKCCEWKEWPLGVVMKKSYGNANGSEGIILLQVTNVATKQVVGVRLSFEEGNLDVLIEGMKDIQYNLKGLTMERLMNIIVAPPPPKISTKEFKSDFLMEYDKTAVEVRGRVAPHDMPVAKKSLTIVSGASGAGKSTYAAFTIPKFEWGLQDAIVCCVNVSNNHKSITNAIKKADKEYRASKPWEIPDEWLCRLFSLAALRWRGDFFHDETKFVAWREYCYSKLGCRDRDKEACDYVIRELKKALQEHCTGSELWFTRDDVEKIKQPVVLVIDEIGKSLPLVRAIVSAQHLIYNNSWVQSHLDTLSIILCGTGAERAHSGMDQLAVATDPSAFHNVEVLVPTENFALKALFTSLRCPTRVVFEKTMPLLSSQERSMPLYAAAKTNVRLLLVVCKLVEVIWTVMMASTPDKDEQAGADAVLAESVGLDRLVAIALYTYLGYNGLRRLGLHAQRVVDATLVEALRGVGVPLLPVAPLKGQKALLNRASSLGLIVRSNGTLPSPAMTAVATFAFSAPGERLEGYALEAFTARWASRLVQAQCGYTSGVRQLRFQVPWKETPPTSEEGVNELLKELWQSKVLVLLNGARAPGADVIVLQLRPRYKKVRKHMTKETYKGLWPSRDIVASMTLVSDKRTGAGFEDQLAKMGVLRRGEPDALRESGPIFLAWLCAKAFVSLGADAPPSVTLDDVLSIDLAKVESLLAGRKIVVRPRLVCGGERSDNDTNWKEKVLEHFKSWAVRERGRYGRCPPATFGPLSHLVRVKEHHNCEHRLV